MFFSWKDFGTQTKIPFGFTPKIQPFRLTQRPGFGSSSSQPSPITKRPKSVVKLTATF